MVDLAAFARNGYARLERPGLRAAADEARALLWARIPPSPVDRSTWTQAVVWTADLSGVGPFGRLAGGRELAGALDEICGPTGWRPRLCLGNIPVRFPGRSAVDDRGWHIDANTPQPDGTWLVSGRPHTMLILTLLSEVGPDDAPTRIRVGSHHDAATVLDGRTAGSAADFGPLLDEASAGRPVEYATGSPGDVYLLHPLCVHAADEHRGRNPRFMAQSPIQLTDPLTEP